MSWLVVALLACGTTEPAEETAETADTAPQRIKKALVIGVDGLRSDALQAASTPAMDQLIARGTVSWDASPQTASELVSGPGWASILTGVDASVHGVVENDGYSQRNPVPTFLLAAKEAGHDPAMSFVWVPISTLVEVEATQVRSVGNDAFVADAAADQIRAGHDLVFVHLDEVDGAGHGFGFSPDVDAYIDAIEGIDANVATLMAAVQADGDGDWLVVLTTDHGGEGTVHGPHNPGTLTIPFVVTGGGHAAGAVVTGGSHMDVGPTVAAHLGFDFAPSGGAPFPPTQ